MSNFLGYLPLYCCSPLSFMLQSLGYPFSLRPLVFFDLVLKLFQFLPVLGCSVIG
jgi:hypothetical protein